MQGWYVLDLLPMFVVHVCVYGTECWGIAKLHHLFVNIVDTY